MARVGLVQTLVPGKMKKVIVLMVLLTCLQGCAAAMVTGAVVGTTVGATKLAVKGGVGATKLAYKGTKAAVSGTARLLSDDDTEEDEAQALSDQ